MKIIIISEWFSEKMGYVENFLPEALGKLGHEVHLITTDLQIYGTSKNYDEVYGQYLGPKKVGTGIFKKNFYTLHRNKHYFKWYSYVPCIRGLEEKIVEIQPDVIYCFEVFVPDTLLCATLKDKYHFKLFTESRMHLSVYNPSKGFLKRIKRLVHKTRSSFLSKKIDKFYPIAPDVLRVLTQHFNINTQKCELASLAVNTDIFYPKKNSAEVIELRNKLGFDQDDVVCLYTGRFTNEKGPAILAKAIHSLHEKGFRQFKGLFVGQGSDEYVQQIKAQKGCVVHPFVSVQELSNFYNAFDVGVWPRQESTSQLDAMSCAMPILINEKVEDHIRVSGNGLQYKDSDPVDLADKILLLGNAEIRKKMGSVGSDKVKKLYSWDYVARKRVKDFNSDS